MADNVNENVMTTEDTENTGLQHIDYGDTVEQVFAKTNDAFDKVNQNEQGVKNLDKTILDAKTNGVTGVTHESLKARLDADSQLIKELDEKHEEDNEYLTNRVNNLITQNNPTEGNSELIDIRLGAGGESYPSAGKAIRNQIKAIKSTLKRGFYVAIGGFPIITENISSGKVIIVLKNDLVFNDGNGNLSNGSTSTSIVSLAEQLGSNAVLSNDAQTLTITLESYRALSFDVSERKYYITQLQTAVKNAKRSIILYTGYGTAFGPLYDIYIKNMYANKDVLNALLHSEKGVCYVSSNGAPKIVENPITAKVTIELKNALVFNDGQGTSGDGLTSATPSELATQLPNSTLSENGSTITITLNSYQCLYFSVLTRKWNIGRINTVSKNVENYIALYTAWGVCFGPLYDIFIKHTVLNTPNAQNVFNSAYVENFDWETKCKEYAALFNGSNNIESFLFFSDPHLLGFGETTDWKKEFQTYISKLQKYYNSIPATYIVCGGDWLNNRDWPELACFKLGYVDGVMRSMFKNYHTLIGNHDTNYQGVKTQGDDKENQGSYVPDAVLSNSAIKNILCSEEGKTYYKWLGKVCCNYALDTQLDNETSVSKYEYEQIDWLANDLISNDYQNSVIWMHIVYKGWNSDSTKRLTSPMADAIGNLISAYNNKTSAVINEKVYNFSSCKGKIDYVLCGHIHEDYIGTLGGVPCISEINMKNGNKLSFDMCLADYDKRILHMVRVGTGSNRSIPF